MDLKRRLDALRREAGLGRSDDTQVPARGHPAAGRVAQAVDAGTGSAPPNTAIRARLERLAGRSPSLPSEAPGTREQRRDGTTPAPEADWRGHGAIGRAATRFGATVGRQGARGTAPSAAGLAEWLGGQVVAEHLVLVETVLPLHERHGRRVLAEALQPLWPLVPLPGVRAEGFGGEPASSTEPSEVKVLGIDTETTGLAGGAGTAAFMVGVAEAGPDGVRLRQWLLTAFSGEAAMLAEVERSLSSADLLVSYNGKTFDLPLLRDRRRLQRAPALPELPHLDLLHPTRRLFRAVWPDCRLATAEQRLLGLSREDDLPGSEAPRAWRDYLAGGPPDDLGRVLRHNALDVLSLLLLGPALTRALQAPAAFRADPLAAADIWERNGDRGRALAVLEDSRAQLDTRGELELAWALRRVGRWAEAKKIWERLARDGCPEAVERLAKYHEHVCRDWSRALEYAARLEDGPEVRHRRDRLKRRLGTPQGRLDFS